MIVLTPQIDKDNAHKAVRRAVKAELQKPDPDPLIIEADTREMGKEDWGTKYGYDTSKILNDDDDWDADFKNRCSRK